MEGRGFFVFRIMPAGPPLHGPGGAQGVEPVQVDIFPLGALKRVLGPLDWVVLATFPKKRIFIAFQVILCYNLEKWRNRVDCIIKDIYFFFDDSGVLHKNEPSGFFVYAGYVFLSRQDLEDAKRKYIHANKQIKLYTNRKGELKAAGLPVKHKRALFTPLQDCESVSLAVDISRVYESILSDKRAICRYKDYVLKRCIKSKLQDLIRRELLYPTEDVRLHINIDEQLTATNGYYNLRDSIFEELAYGISNWDYGTFHPNVFSGKVSVEISYCESKNNYLIQASDILANRIWTSYRTNNFKLRSISNHLSLTFP